MSGALEGGPMIAEFAQIVGLLAAFSTGRQTSKIADIQEFLDWLSEHNLSELRDKIEQSQSTITSIKALLNQNFEDISRKLDAISSQLATLVNRTSGVEELAKPFATEALSNQAYELLFLMNENKTQFMLVMKSFGSNPRLSLSPGPDYEVTEPQFLEDDLSNLVSLGLLLHEITDQGNDRYRFTRSASKLFSGEN